MADAIVDVSEDKGPGISKITWDWTSATDGSGSGATSEAYTGEIRRVVVDPDDSTPPTAAYDITITDDDGYAVLDTTVAPVLYESLDIPHSAVVLESKLTMTLTSAGEEKSGTVIVYVAGM